MEVGRQYSCPENPMDGGAWWAAVHGVAKSQTWLSDFTFTFYFHALEKEMAIHSSVLAWSISGMGELGGLPSMGSHRVGHDWSDLAAAAGCFQDIRWKESWHVILNCNLDTTLLWAQTNDFISCACFFFFFQSPDFSSSFVSRGTCHLKPSPLCIVNQEQIQEREWDRDQYLVSAWTLC